jgi:hypothetical protein
LRSVCDLVHGCRVRFGGHGPRPREQRRHAGRRSAAERPERQGPADTRRNTVECPTSILVGTLTSNDASKDKVTITSGAYTGPNGVLCTTSTSLGPVEIAAGGLPWTQEFAKTGKAQLKGKKKLRLTVTVPALLSLQCTYEAPKLAETFTLAAGERPTPLLLTLADQDFVRSSGSGALCPGQISTGGAAVAVAAYGPGGALLPVSVTRRRSAG